MYASQVQDSERPMLRWGGLAGVVGSVVMIAVFIIVGAFVGDAAADPASALIRFPDIQVARTVENGLYLVALALWAVHVVGLDRGLGVGSVAATVGGALSLAGLTALVAGALPHVATVPISALYEAPGATAADQATLLLIWRAIQGLFDAILFAGMALLAVGLVSFGVAMRRTPAFGTRLAVVAMGLGAIGVVATTMVLIDPKSPVAALGFLGLIAFHLVVGRKLLVLSRGSRTVPEPATPAAPAGPSRVALGER